MEFLRSNWRTYAFALASALLIIGAIIATPYLFATSYERAMRAEADVPSVPVLDRADYDRRMLTLAHIKIASTTLFRTSDVAATSPGQTFASSTGSMSSPQAASSTPLLVATTTASTSVSVLGKAWPTPAAYPRAGAILPFHRIVAYYGNFYSTKMGVLGEYAPAVMLAKLASTTAAWTAADPATPAIPAIDYIAVVAQGSAGKDGMYRARMPDTEIDKALAYADAAHGIVVLDVQVGKSTVQQELPLLAKYLAMPQVHLALDPEFAMKPNERPGTVIGSMDARDINWAAQYLAKIVDDNNLPPKVLLIHRFTEAMVTHTENLVPLPEVQMVMDMDGFGTQSRKLGTYYGIVAPEPVQFTGFKLFYKNDIPPRGDAMMTPAKVISLTPSPIFIQYQ